MSEILKVSWSKIRTIEVNWEDFICLTDIAKEKWDRSEQIIQNWMRNRNTIEYLSLWEELNNTNFKHLKSEVFKKEIVKKLL